MQRQGTYCIIIETCAVRFVGLIFRRIGKIQAEDLNGKTPHPASRSVVMSFCNSKAFPCCGGDVNTDLRLGTPGARGCQLEGAALRNAGGAVVVTASFFFIVVMLLEKIQTTSNVIMFISYWLCDNKIIPCFY